MRKQALLLAGVLATATGGWALAQRPPEGPAPGPRGERRGPGAADPARLAHELGLNEQQTAQLKKLQLDGRKAAIRRNADTQLARLGLQELMDAPSVDEKALQARVKELSDLHAARLRARVDAQLALRKILTPEQQEKLKQLREQRPRPRFDREDARPGRGLRRGPGQGPRPGEDDDDVALTGPESR
jgi:Spy/CpxP family protein refolding chaperone